MKRRWSSSLVQTRSPISDLFADLLPHRRGEAKHVCCFRFCPLLNVWLALCKNVQTNSETPCFSPPLVHEDPTLVQCWSFSVSGLRRSSSSRKLRLIQAWVVHISSKRCFILTNSCFKSQIGIIVSAGKATWCLHPACLSRSYKKKKKKKKGKMS